MRFRVLATDFDGTIAHDGTVEAETYAALQQARREGVRLVLVTGRELSSLFNTFDGAEVFERIVAENGAISYDPTTQRVKALSIPPPPLLLERLEQQGIPISVGHSIVATVSPHEATMHAAIQELGLPWHVILNKDAIMALPRGVTKATGLTEALADMGAIALDTVGVGDAENDAALLQMCGLSVAVANALPELKAMADVVTAGAHGDGVRELLARWHQL